VAVTDEPVLPRRPAEEVTERVYDATDRLSAAGSDLSDEVQVLLGDIRSAVTDGVAGALQGTKASTNYAPSFALGVLFGVLMCVVVFVLAFVLATLR
jgi:hypothetical protein